MHPRQFTEPDILLAAIRALFVESKLLVKAYLAVKLVAIFIQAPMRVTYRLIADQALELIGHISIQVSGSID